MPHTNDWDDNLPQDNENAGLGAQRIRVLKDNIQDRMKIGHTWGESTIYDGEHKYDKVVLAGSVSGTYNINLANGRIFYMTLSENVTLSISDSDGMSTSYARSFILAVKQGSSNVYTLTFPSTAKFHNNTEINVTANAGWVTMYQFLSFDNGSHWIATHIGDFSW